MARMLNDQQLIAFQMRIEQLQKEPHLWNAFLSYTEKRRVRETVGFFIAVSQYEKFLKTSAIKIWDEYRSSSTQLVLSSDTRTQISTNLSTPSIAMFQGARLEITRFLVNNVLSKFDKSTELLQDEQTKINHFLRILHNPKQRKKFKILAKKCNAAEQVKFWFKIESFEDKVLAEALSVWDWYIAEDSQSQVNISAKVLKQLRLKMATPDTETFNDVKREIGNLFVMDVMPGFEEYLEECSKNNSYPHMNPNLAFKNYSKQKKLMKHSRIASGGFNKFEIEEKSYFTTSEHSVGIPKTRSLPPSESSSSSEGCEYVEWNSDDEHGLAGFVIQPDYIDVKKLSKIFGRKVPLKRRVDHQPDKKTHRSNRKIISLLGEIPFREKVQFAPQPCYVDREKLKKVFGEDKVPIQTNSPFSLHLDKVNTLFDKIKEDFLMSLETQRQICLDEIRMIECPEGEVVTAGFAEDDQIRFGNYKDSIASIKEEIFQLREEQKRLKQERKKRGVSLTPRSSPSLNYNPKDTRNRMTKSGSFSFSSPSLVQMNPELEENDDLDSSDHISVGKATRPKKRGNKLQTSHPETRAKISTKEEEE